MTDCSRKQFRKLSWNHHHHRYESVPLFNFDSIQSGASPKLTVAVGNLSVCFSPTFPLDVHTGKRALLKPTIPVHFRLRTKERTTPFSILQLVKTAPNWTAASASLKTFPSRDNKGKGKLWKALYRALRPRGPARSALEWLLYFRRQT